MKFPFLKAKKQYTLILDLGTEAIKALIVEKGNNVILGSSKNYLTSDLLEFKTLKKSILRAGTAAQDKAKVAPTIVTLGLPADILKTRVSFSSYRRKFPKTTINLQEEKDICQKAIERSRREICQSISEKSGILPDDIQFVDFKILEIKIDGYQTSRLNGFSGRNLEFRILTVFLPKHIEKYGNCGFEFLSKNIQDLGWKTIQIAYPLQNLIKNNKESKALYLDVGGTLTQFVIIENGNAKKIEEFAIGGENFSQIIAETLGVSLSRARILKHKYTKKLVSEPTRNKIKEILAPCVNNWFETLKSKLAAENSLIPENILLFGGGSILPDVAEILEEGDWNNIHFSGPIKIEYVSSKYIDLGPSADSVSPQFIPSLLLCKTEFLDFTEFNKNIF